MVNAPLYSEPGVPCASRRAPARSVYVTYPSIIKSVTVYETVSLSTSVAAVTVPSLKDRLPGETEAASMSSLKSRIISAGATTNVVPSAGVVDVTASGSVS